MKKRFSAEQQLQPTLNGGTGASSNNDNAVVIIGLMTSITVTTFWSSDSKCFATVWYARELGGRTKSNDGVAARCPADTRGHIPPGREGEGGEKEKLIAISLNCFC